MPGLQNMPNLSNMSNLPNLQGGSQMPIPNLGNMPLGRLGANLEMGVNGSSNQGNNMNPLLSGNMLNMPNIANLQNLQNLGLSMGNLPQES